MKDPNLYLFEKYGPIPQQASVVCFGIDDARFLRDIGNVAASVTIFHENGSAIDYLKRRLDASKFDVRDTVFPDGETHYDRALIGLPKGRELARAVLSTYFATLKTNGILFAAGGNKSGAKTSQTDLAEFANTHSLGTKKRHRIFSAMRAGSEEIPQAWLDLAQPSPVEISYQEEIYKPLTQPGIFSYQHLDEGTQHLLDALQSIKSEQNIRLLDAACGYGIVGMVAQKVLSKATIVCADNNLLAVSCAQKNVSEANVYMTDLTSDRLLDEERFDLIVCNPPFHRKHDKDISFVERFIPHVKEYFLKPNGDMLIVFNRFLPYPELLGKHFSHVDVVVDDSKFYVMHCKL